MQNNFDKTFVGIGLGVITLFTPLGLFFILIAQLTVVNCQRFKPNQGYCEVKVLQGLFQKEKENYKFPLSQLQKADLQISRSAYRVVLITKQKEIPLTYYYESGRQSKAEIADQINTFIIDNSQTDLNLQQGDRWFNYLIGGTFIVISNIIGITFIWVGLANANVFNKNTTKS